MEIPISILKKINERKAADAFRSLRIHASGVDFYSNDYLGMAKVETKQNQKHGATGSRLISGHYPITEILERKYAEFFNQETALLYNSGYDANLGIFSSVPQRGDTVIYDELCHASIRDGIRLGLAKSYSFKHNDLDNLDLRLSKADGVVYVVIESVYSMDGDLALLNGIVKLCDKYGAYLIVDEAHSGGVIGDRGEGLVTSLGLDASVFIKVITFGKAFGSHGAVVLSNSTIKDYLINFSRSLIYTTAISPNVQERIVNILDHIAEAKEERKKLEAIISYFQTQAKNNMVDVLVSKSPIQAVLLNGNSLAKAKAEDLISKGFAVKAILSPTVPEGKERIRICIHSYNTRQQIDELIKALK